MTQETDLPNLSSPAAKNISLFGLVETAIERGCPALVRRGVTRRHERGARDAMDDDGAARRAALSRTAKSCGPDTPTLVSSLRVTARQATVATKPGSPRRPRRKP